MNPSAGAADRPSCDDPRWGGSEHAWERSAGLWIWATWSTLALSTALAVAETWGSWARMVAAVVTALAFGGWFAVVGLVNLRFDRGPWTGRIFVAGMIVIQAAALAISPAFFLLSFVTYALCFVMIDPLGLAVAAVAVLSAVIALSNLWWESDLTAALIQGVIAFAAASILGVFISRIIEESRLRAELITTLEETRDELAAAHREAGVAAERARLASEIHDTLAQGFTSLLALSRAAQARLGPEDAEALRLLHLAETTAAENLAEARALVAALQPVPLRSASLRDALGRIATHTAEECGIEVDVDVVGVPRLLPPSEEVVLLRAGQEALANVRKHAAARVVRMILDYGDVVTLTVTDDGRGFDPREPSSGFGLQGMQARLDAAGGELTVVSRPGTGTTVRVTVP